MIGRENEESTVAQTVRFNRMSSLGPCVDSPPIKPQGFCRESESSQSHSTSNRSCGSTKLLNGKDMSIQSVPSLPEAIPQTKSTFSRQRQLKRRKSSDFSQSSDHDTFAPNSIKTEKSTLRSRELNQQAL